MIYSNTEVCKVEDADDLSSDAARAVTPIDTKLVKA